MATAPPPLLSGLAETLLRRPPSLRELVTLIGYAEDYAWFTALVRRLFPDDAEAALSAPNVGARVENFARLFQERHFPLYAPYLEFCLDDGDDPPWTWLRRGIPFQLMGFGYEGLHEMWEGYREGLSALALLAESPDFYYDEPGGLRTAWLECAAQRIPQETLERIPRGGIPVEGPDRSSAGNRTTKARPRPSPGCGSETGNFFLDHCYEDGDYDGFSDPWEEEIIADGTEEWRKADRLMDSVLKLADWLEGDLPARFAELLDFILPRLPEPEQHNRRKTMTMANDVAYTGWSPPGPADLPKDELQAQLEVYSETILLRGFEGDRTWVRTVSADEIANVFTRHLGFASGLLPENALWWSQGRDRADGGPVAPPTGLAGGPATGGVPASRPAPAAHAGAGLHLLPGTGALGLCRPGTAHRPGPAALPRPGLQRLPATGGPAPAATASPKRWARIPESFFQSFFSLTGDTTERSKQHPDNLQALWEELDGRTDYPVEDLVPQCTVGRVMAASRRTAGLLLARRPRRWATW